MNVALQLYALLTPVFPGLIQVKNHHKTFCSKRNLGMHRIPICS